MKILNLDRFQETFGNYELTDADYLELICVLNRFEGQVWISGSGETSFTAWAESIDELKDEILCECIDNKDIIKDEVKRVLQQKNPSHKRGWI